MLMGSSRGGARANFLQDEYVSSVLLKADSVGFNIPEDAVEVVLVDAKELASVLSRYDSCCPVNSITPTINLDAVSHKESTRELWEP